MRQPLADLGLPLVTVCIGATRAETIGATVKAIRAQTFTDWELLVVAQGRPEPLHAAVLAAAQGDARVGVIDLAERGLSRARNAAVGHARGPILAFTDDDCEPAETWLELIVAAFRQGDKLGLVGGAVVSPAPLGPLATCPTISPAEALYDPEKNPRRPPAGWDWIGANFAITREAAERNGRFDECLGAGTDFPAGEDTDYKLRLEAAGVRMLSTPRVAVVHANGVRRGWKAMLRSQRNYATGNGAMAGKLTLMGDRRGREWLEETRRDCIADLTKPHRSLRALRRMHYFNRAYDACVDGYLVDGGCLKRL